MSNDIDGPEDRMHAKSFVNGMVLISGMYMLHIAAFEIYAHEIVSDLAAFLGLSSYTNNISGNIGEALLEGIIFGEICCLALWVNCSTGRQSFRLVMYCWFAFQLVLAIWQVSSNQQPMSTDSFMTLLHYWGIAAYIVFFDFLALHLTPNRIRISKSSAAMTDEEVRGFTVLQGLYATLVIAAMLSGIGYARKTYDPAEIFVLAIVWGSVFSLISVAGLWIAKFEYPIVVQALVSIAIAIMISTIYHMSLLRASPGWLACLTKFTPSIILPLLLVKFAPRFGFRLNVVGRESVPLAESSE